ncbi:hypothetical protein ACGFT2_12580 [Streptomyces sp. NPDC048514]|uniref:hypothetical protein n=1 Tax=Streptomyces sp. NPDC048514 TaxID=3365564 RepID=UPI00371311F7
MNANRLRPAVIACAAVALAAALTACQGEDSTTGAGAAQSASAKAGSTAGTSGGGKGGSTATAAPGTRSPGSGSSGSGGAGTSTAKPAPKTTGPAGTTAPAADCATKAPDPDHADPDEIVVNRVEELPAGTGKVNLVIQHGAWGCPGKETDGRPFLTDGEDSRWALDQAAYVTATNPITSGSKNQHIGVQELIDWLDAHPDAGLVFKYETGDDGAIHSLRQVYAP